MDMDMDILITTLVTLPSNSGKNLSPTICFQDNNNM